MNRSGSGFELLSSNVQKWVFDQGWAELREIQEASIPAVLSRDRDVLISSPTASGKTEAAFLPLFSLLDKGDADLVVVISPLKALINDQAFRLTPLAEACGVHLTPWHGDAPAGPKRKFEANPRGVLMITPESLEAMHVLRGPAVKQMLAHVDAFVVDELHSFVGGERGRQLQSLLERIESAAGSFRPRIGLSATMGDIGDAAAFLRPTGSRHVQTIDLKGDGRELRLGVQGFVGDELDAFPEIAREVFQQLRGRDQLLFANSRRDVELLSDELRSLSELRSVPNEYFPHHGSLSRAQREFVEHRLRQSNTPMTAVCTSTLELGIDVGTVESIGQVGAPHSVSALRQRLGRSGRRAEDPAVLRVFLRELPPADRESLYERLGVPTVQTIAVIDLLLAGWCETPRSDMLGLSTLVQQLLSVIAERNGIRVDSAWDLLCAQGAFPLVDQRQFAALLRSLHQHDLIQQAGDGELMLGVAGEHLTAHYDFYSAFTSPVEYRVVTAGADLGSLPVAVPVAVGMPLVFSGRRWVIDAVDDDARIILVVPTNIKKATRFSGAPGFLDMAIREQMFKTYAGREVAPYLDPRAQEFLSLARDEFRHMGLERSPIVGGEDEWLVFPWCGDRGMITLLWIFRARGLDARMDSVAVRVSHAPLAEVKNALSFLVEGSVDAAQLSAIAEPKSFEKHHGYLTEELLSADYASSVIDLDEAKSSAAKMLHAIRVNVT